MDIHKLLDDIEAHSENCCDRKSLYYSRGGVTGREHIIRCDSCDSTEIAKDIDTMIINWNKRFNTKELEYQEILSRK